MSLSDSEKLFFEWFEKIHGRKWEYISNEEQDITSMCTKRGWEAGFLAGWCDDR